jgi:tyrosyl-tRNA synthetase
MLARDVCYKVGQKIKPLIISHHMLSGLKQGQAKMSKSDPDSAIFMEDTVKDVQRKINSSYCPDKIIEENPVLDYTKNIIFPSFDQMTVDGRVIENQVQLEAEYKEGTITPN